MVHKQSRSTWFPLLPTVNNLVAMEHKQSKPIVEQGSPNKFEPQCFKMIHDDDDDGIKNYCFEVPLNGITIVANLMKF
jgi:hypothetical protein